MLIEELLLLQRHIAKLEAQIEEVVSTSREGRILLSVPGIGAQRAAVLVAAIGNILNFPTAADLKSYLGWSPDRVQTGTSVDRVSLAATGTRATRALLYLAVMSAIKEDGVWADLYQRLVPKKCTVAGRMICTIYMLLKTDAERLATVQPDMEPPDPVLYDPAVHKAHVAGGYVSAKTRPTPLRIVKLPKRAEE
jgi:hypothetical protein